MRVRIRLLMAGVLTALAASVMPAWTPPAAEAATLSVDDFVSSYNGKYIDVDGVPVGNLYQCVDLFNLYHQKVLGGSYVRMSISGGAKDLWSTSNSGQVNDMYVRISKSAAARKGDVAVWGGYSSGYTYSDYGHVAIVLSNASGSSGSLSTLTQNPGATAKKTLSKTGLLGYLRPKRFALYNTGAPSVSGTPKVGTKLTAKAGSWSVSGTSYKYQWYASGSSISGATSSTFTPTSTQYGKTIQVKVTASKSGYTSVSATSGKTAAVAKGTFSNTAAPAISGTAQVGATLSVSTGTWSPTPSSYSYQWYAGGLAIAGATASSFTPTVAEVGQTITATVSVERSGYTTTSTTSAATGPVANGTMTNTTVPTITGDPVVGETLTATSGTWSPEPDTWAYQWYADGVAIDGATGETLTLTAAQEGTGITVTQTASKAGYDDDAITSAATVPVATGTLVEVAAPRLRGKPKVGRTLTATGGRWSPDPDRITYRWSVGGKSVGGAHKTSLTLKKAMAGKSVKVVVTVAKDGYGTETVVLRAASRVAR